MIIDFLFFGIAGIGFMIGYRKGVIQLILTVFSTFIGFLLTIRFTPNMNELLKDFFRMDSLFMPILSFFLTFVVAMVFIRIAAQVTESFFKSSNMGEFNQVAGGVLLAIFGLFLYSGVIWFLMKAEIVETLTEEQLQNLDPSIRNRKESKTLPFVQLFLQQSDLFTARTTEMFNELFKDIQMVWESNKSE